MLNFSDVPVETRFFAVAESAPDAIISANGEGHIIYWNPAATRIFGWEAHEVIGRSLTMIIPNGYRDAHQNGMTRLYETGEKRHIGSIVELEGLHRDGHIFPIELSLSMWRDEVGERFFNGIIRDISERKSAEQMQKEYAATLEMRNQELYAYDRTIAHDLKNPLGLIATYARLIQMNHASALPEKSQEQLDRIISASKKMVEMLDQLLILANLRDTQSVTKPLDPRPILDKVLERYHNRFREENFKVSVPSTYPIVVAHELWLEQIFMNLIGNALKYKGKGNTAPTIVIRHAVVGEMVRFEIEDNGLGIPAEAQKTLFEAFERVHPNEADGSGVGLSIVQRIVQRLNGQLGVTSEVGKGSTFWFTLPGTTAADRRL